MTDHDFRALLELDRAHTWHPYASATHPPLLYPVIAARGVELELADGRRLIDGMSSWWCAIHGYNHPRLNRAASGQLEKMSHVMFGGLTHPGAARLCERLVEITPAGLERVFLSDSGSVSVEVALKMCLQYWQARGKRRKQQFVALRHGYHGDTIGAMAVCDPVTGMHHLFGEVLPSHFFAEAPRCGFGEDCEDEHFADMRGLLLQHHRDIAAVIVEPIVQGAGGMRFYAADYLVRLRRLCDEFDCLLIFDEIATGFGRTGKLFAAEHAAVTPDILCLGKALTGGYMTLAATLTRDSIAAQICAGAAGAFMHGPTFMGNPLACAVALASIELLLSQDWQAQIASIQRRLQDGLQELEALPTVADVRCLGAIGVVEMRQPVSLDEITPLFVEQGIWLRPFGKLVYTMPPYISSDADLAAITGGISRVLTTLSARAER